MPTLVIELVLALLSPSCAEKANAKEMADAIGFGDLGVLELNDIRSYSTRHIHALSHQGMRFARMYTELS